jgi:CRP-like cAMP-binding protein
MVTASQTLDADVTITKFLPADSNQTQQYWNLFTYLLALGNEVMKQKSTKAGSLYVGMTDKNLRTSRERTSVLEKEKSNRSINFAEIPVFCPTVQEGTGCISDLPPAEQVSAGVVLAKQDNESSHVRLIQSGIVKLSYLNRSGQEFIIGLRTKGWWISSTQALLGVRNLYNVVTLTRCSYSSITAEDFSQRLLSDPHMMQQYLSSIGREAVIQSKLHILLQSASATNRLNQMLEEHEKSVWKTLDTTSIVRQTDMAKLLSVTPEHLCRILNKSTGSRRKSSRAVGV